MLVKTDEITHIQIRKMNMSDASNIALLDQRHFDDSLKISHVMIDFMYDNRFSFVCENLHNQFNIGISQDNIDEANTLCIENANDDQHTFHIEMDHDDRDYKFNDDMPYTKPQNSAYGNSFDDSCSVEYFCKNKPKITRNGFIDRCYKNSSTGRLIHNAKTTILGCILAEKVKDCDFIIITSLCVDYDYSSRGIGKALLQRCIDEIKKLEPKKKIRLTVRTDNKKAVNLYQNFGFKIVHTEKLTYFDGCDGFVMEKC